MVIPPNVTEIALKTMEMQEVRQSGKRSDLIKNRMAKKINNNNNSPPPPPPPPKEYRVRRDTKTIYN